MRDFDPAEIPADLLPTRRPAADVRARIPMAEGTDSLNVATAAAVAFYERARRD